MYVWFAHDWFKFQYLCTYVCRYTASSDGSKIYAFVTSWPGESVQLGAVTYNPTITISMLGHEGNLPFDAASPGIRILFPRPDLTTSKWTWTLVITN